MKTKAIITMTILMFFTCVDSSSAQGTFAIKKWRGRYPRMNNNYPLAFVCWKGWLPPKPRFFVRIYPSHYYYYLKSMPVTDSKSYVETGLYDGLKLILKNIDKKALQKSMQVIGDIKLNQAAHEAIEAFLRQSRLEYLPDIYSTGNHFYQALQALDHLQQQNGPVEISRTFENEIQHYLEELVMINRLDAKQGDKLKAMEVLNRQVRQLTGTIHYTTHKIRTYGQRNQVVTSNLSFLG